MEKRRHKFLSERRKRFLARVKRKILARHILFVRFGVFLSIFVFLSLFVAVGVFFLKFSGYYKYAELGFTFIFASNKKVKSTDGRTNLLFLGLSGDGEKNPILSDTMIVASFDIYGSGVDLIPVPRDIWIEELGDKLNGAYRIGNERRAGGGIVLAKSYVEEILGIPIHYGFSMNFDGFKEVVDYLGGVEVDVPRSFEDKKYPIEGREEDLCDGDPEYACRYETIRFEKGLTTMDGGTALKYVRSRHSEDLEEGTDFARTRRAQLVMVAIKDKLVSRDFLYHPRKLFGFWDLIKSISETDMDEYAQVFLARKAYDFRNKIKMHDFEESLLKNPPFSDYNNLYVLVPIAGDWSGMHEWVGKIIGENSHKTGE